MELNKLWTKFLQIRKVYKCAINTSFWFTCSKNFAMNNYLIIFFDIDLFQDLFNLRKFFNVESAFNSSLFSTLAYHLIIGFNTTE